MTNGVNNRMDAIDESIMNECIDNYFKEQEKNRWKNEDRFKDFLSFLIDYIDKNERVLSDNFYYQEDDCKPYTYREFETYLNSLYDIVSSYATKNYIYDEFNVSQEDCFTESSYCLKIKDKFYKIELVSGQGSYISFEIANNDENISYVGYDLMMNDEKPPFYEHNLKEMVHSNLEYLIEKISKDGADKDLIRKLIKEF